MNVSQQGPELDTACVESWNLVGEVTAQQTEKQGAFLF